MSTCVILLAHGSAVREWQHPFESVAASVRSEVPSADVRIAYLQFAQPTFMEAVRNARLDGAEEIVVLPLFLSRGKHMRDDVPALVADVIRTYPDLPVRVLPTIGEDARFWELITQLIAERLRTTTTESSTS